MAIRVAGTLILPDIDYRVRARPGELDSFRRNLLLLRHTRDFEALESRWRMGEFADEYRFMVVHEAGNAGQAQHWHVRHAGHIRQRYLCSEKPSHVSNEYRWWPDLDIGFVEDAYDYDAGVLHSVLCAECLLKILGNDVA